MSETLSPNTDQPAATDQPALGSRYQPQDLEARWVKRWAEQPFLADPHSGKEPFTIVIPPPNITGNLHLGHAFDNTLIDVLIRFKRMQGFEALFQPGSDHAGISTQVVVERALREEGLDRHQLGREAFLARVWDWKERYGGIIEQQLHRLGVSADWSRSRFTMDEGLSKAVRKQFVELYHRGHVFRGERIVHWDPVSQTTLSDLEVEREDRPGRLYHLAYELEDGSGHIEIATQRPETIFADQAVAVHPDDPRYVALLGRSVRIPLTDRLVPVIADEAVEMDFGSGALKVTPAHDATDFEIGRRHGLATPSVIDLHARLQGDLVPEAYRGMDRFEAREAVVLALREGGALLSEREHTVPMALSQRTGEPVEPLLSTQWFYDTSVAAQQVLRALDGGEIELVPERYTKVNRDWLEKLHPWNISRQLWWGHRIPAWYTADGELVVPSPDDPYLDPPDDPKYEGVPLIQDPDVFDTWFSSNLWPFSTLGWPDESDPFFQRFYPTSVLVTGYDILFFWVARMQIAGFEFTGRAPFHTVMLHGLVLDAHGQKMSKSKGNGVDPLDVIEQSGADALRFAMAYVSTGGQDIRWDDRRVEMGRNFGTKLWNAARFVLSQLEGEAPASEAGTEPSADRLADRWIRSRFERARAAVTESVEAYDLGAAARAVYDFAWSEFCDWYLEAAKPALRQGDAGTRATLRWTLEGLLKLLHPVMPFVTSELWEALGHESQLALAQWPAPRPQDLDTEAEAAFERLQAAVGAVRQLRIDADLPPGQMLPLLAKGDGAGALTEEASVFGSLARVELREDAPAGAVLRQPVADLVLELPLEGLVDLDAWREKQTKRLAAQRSEVERSNKKLANERFVQSAPAVVVEEERRRLAEAQRLVEEIERSLARVG